MMISCCFICVFAVLINKVSLQVTVEAVIGGFVVLPCSSTKHHLKPQDIEVFWRHNDSKIVFDIIKGKNSETQDPRYKNRVEPFTNLRRNYSIKLSDLNHADAGKYVCHITPSNEQETVELIIKESRAETGNKSSNQENQGDDSGADNVGKSGPLLWVCIVVPVLVIEFALIADKCKPRAASFSSVSTEEQTTVP